MRALILTFCAALTLSGCGKQATGNTASVDEDFTAADVVTNDATAIDAAMGADANMAADVDLNFGLEGTGNNASTSRRGVDSRPESRLSPARSATGNNTNEASNTADTTDEVDANAL